MGFFLVLVLSCISAGLSSSIASAKGWGSSNWLLAGLFFGPLGLIAAAGLPDRKLRHYLFELSKQQGVSRELLEPGPIAPASGGLADQFDFQTDPLTTDDEVWSLITKSLPDSIRERASRNSSSLKKNSSRMLVRSTDGQHLAEARRIHSSMGIVYWKLIDRP